VYKAFLKHSPGMVVNFGAQPQGERHVRQRHTRSMRKLTYKKHNRSLIGHKN